MWTACWVLWFSVFFLLSISSFPSARSASIPSLLFILFSFHASSLTYSFLASLLLLTHLPTFLSTSTFSFPLLCISSPYFTLPFLASLYYSLRPSFPFCIHICSFFCNPSINPTFILLPWFHLFLFRSCLSLLPPYVLLSFRPCLYLFIPSSCCCFLLLSCSSSLFFFFSLSFSPFPCLIYVCFPSVLLPVTGWPADASCSISSTLCST